MNTQTPDTAPTENPETPVTGNSLRENVIDPLMENARQLPGRASAEWSQGAEQIRARVLKSAEDLQKSTFADHICSPPKML